MPFLGGKELAQVYAKAKREKFALLANNFAETNVLLGVLAAHVAKKSDLLLQISQGAAKFAGGGNALAGLRALVSYVKALTASYPIGVFVNLDHVTPDAIDSFIVPALQEGLCSSVMIDASDRPFEENVAITKKVVELARPYGVLVEGELGRIKGAEEGIVSEEAFYTDPDEAVEYVERTGVDLLAISVGTQHGVSAGKELKLRVDLAQRIDERLKEAGLERPLVLHGASGLTAEQVRAWWPQEFVRSTRTRPTSTSTPAPPRLFTSPSGTKSFLRTGFFLTPSPLRPRALNGRPTKRFSIPAFWGRKSKRPSRGWPRK